MGESIAVRRVVQRRSTPTQKTAQREKRAGADVDRVDQTLLLLFRGVALAALAVLALYQSEADQALAQAYAWLREQWWFKHDSFEPVLSSLCFQVYILGWRLVDMTQVFRRYRIQKHSPETPWDDAWDRLKVEGFWYLFPLLLVDVLFPRRKLTEEAPTAFGVLAQVAMTISIYDILFFFGHSLLHSNPWLYKTFHSKHHKHSSVRACESIRHNIADGTYDVICSIVALRVVGSHPVARAMHNIVIIWLLTELHAGYDAPWQLHNIVPFAVIGGPPRHDHHHNFGHHYHQKFFTFLDFAFGYEPPQHKAPVSLAQKNLGW